MASYLLQETGDKISLEDASGFLLLEGGAPTPTHHGGAPGIIQTRRIPFDDVEAAAVAIILAARRRRWTVR